MSHPALQPRLTRSHVTQLLAHLEYLADDCHGTAREHGDQYLDGYTDALNEAHSMLSAFWAAAVIAASAVEHDLHQRPTMGERLRALVKRR